MCLCVCVCVNEAACKSVKFKCDSRQFSCTQCILCVMINIRLILHLTAHSTGLLLVLTAAQNSEFLC